MLYRPSSDVTRRSVVTDGAGSTTRGERKLARTEGTGHTGHSHMEMVPDIDNRGSEGHIHQHRQELAPIDTTDDAVAQ